MSLDFLPISVAGRHSGFGSFASDRVIPSCVECDKRCRKHVVLVTQAIMIAFVISIKTKIPFGCAVSSKRINRKDECIENIKDKVGRLFFLL